MTNVTPVTKPHAFWTDAFERLASTFVQVFLVTLLASNGVVHVPWADALTIAAFAALISLVTTVLLWLVTKVPYESSGKRALSNPYVDIVYRAVVTFVQSVLGLMLAAGSISALNFDWDAAGKIALVAAGTAILKGLIGKADTSTAGASVTVPRVITAP